MVLLKNVASYLKSFFAFFKGFKLLKSLNLINNSSLSNCSLTPTLRKQLRGQIDWCEYGYLYLLSLPIHWIASHFLNIAFFTNYFKRIFIVYSCVCCVCCYLFWKLTSILNFFDLVWVGVQCDSIEGPVFFVLFL